MRRLVVSICAALAVAPLCSQDIPAPERYQQVRRAIRSAIDAGQTPALSIAVLERGAVVWAEGFGMADVEREREATAHTIYRLASISKPFTATALMQLVERGKLALDDPVNTHLERPGVVARRGVAKDITLRRLANHTAGLPTHWSFFYGDHEPPPRAETIRRYGFAAWPPGTRTNYSNLAFGILDHVIARTSGESYRDFLVAELLDPLGMGHTDVGIRPDKREHAALAYKREGRRFVPVTDYGFDHDGASAVRSSALDLMTFARLQIGGGKVGHVKVLSRGSALAMRKHAARNAGSRYGIGWGVTTKKGALRLNHTGGMPGVSTALDVFPGQSSAVAVLCNCKTRALVNRTVRTVVDILLREVQPEHLPMAGTPGPQPPHPARHTAAPVGRYTGAILHPDGAIPLELTIGRESAVTLRLGETNVAELAQRHVRRHELRLRFEAPLTTTASFRGVPTLDLELDRAPAGETDGWRGVLYASGPQTLRLPHWVKLERARD